VVHPRVHLHVQGLNWRASRPKLNLWHRFVSAEINMGSTAGKVWRGVGFCGLGGWNAIPSRHHRSNQQFNGNACWPRFCGATL